MTKKKKFYVVWVGHTPGVYDSWAKAQTQIKGYPQAKYKSFFSLEEAKAAYSGNFHDHIGAKAAQSPKPKVLPATMEKEVVWDSVAVDAACSGNPGKMEYQGVHTRDGAQLFHQAFPLGTNNIGEFLALVHALALLKQSEPRKPIYTDSRNAIKWVQQGKCRTTLKRSAATAQLFQVIERAEQWLANHTFENPILKWETERWGEIPADFGRK